MPVNEMLPFCGRYTPFKQLKIDVLPAPFGPMTAKSSPSRTSKLTSRSALTPPNESETSFTSRSGPSQRRGRSSAAPGNSRSPMLMAPTAGVGGTT